MRNRWVPATTMVALLALLAAPALADPVVEDLIGTAPTASQFIESTQPENDGPSEADAARFIEAARSLSTAPSAVLAEPESLFSWPLANALHDDLILVNYVDDDRTAGRIRDYRSGPHSYDGHFGTDITLLNFREMDRGMPVLAAADGVVIATDDGWFDREMGTNSNPANFVYIDHENGVRSLYYHLRKGSTAVHLHERVRRGDVIGLAGSSGSSTDAHLHFEVNTPGPPYVRDPWHGTFNTLPSLWRVQEPYVGTTRIRFYDMGLFNLAGLAGNIGARDLKERITQPATFGADESILGLWVQLQGLAGVAYQVQVIRPDGSAFSDFTARVPGTVRYGWQSWYWNGLSQLPQGTWKAVLRVNGIVVRTLDFTVGPQTIYAPRFSAGVAKSFHMNGQPYVDQLQVDALGGPATFSLLNAPPNVSFVGSDRISITTPQRPSRARSTYFQVVATNTAGLRDTAWYHLVDPRAPLSVLPARVFTKDGHRTIPIGVPDTPGTSLAPVCLQIEPIDGDFEVSDVDPASIQMISPGTGSVGAIGAVATKRVVVADADGNGVAEAPACFALADLARLFSNVTGRGTVTVAVEADLTSGGHVSGDVDLTVVRTGANLAVAVGPNPAGRYATITFTTRAAGALRVEIFDLQGRLVRRVMEASAAPAGNHEVKLDGLGGSTGSLRSGVYFYRVQTGEGVGTGRFVVVR